MNWSRPIHMKWLYSSVNRGSCFGSSEKYNYQCEQITSRLYSDKLLMKHKLLIVRLNGGSHRTLEYLVNCLLSSWTSISRLLNSFSSLRIAAWGIHAQQTHTVCQIIVILSCVSNHIQSIWRCFSSGSYSQFNSLHTAKRVLVFVLLVHSCSDIDLFFWYYQQQQQY